MLTTDFEPSQGYSYNDLINFLNAYKEFFRDCYNSKESLKGEIFRKDRTFSDYETKIKELEDRIKKLESDNKFLTNTISRKLTIKERLFGKFKW